MYADAIAQNDPYVPRPSVSPALWEAFRAAYLHTARAAAGRWGIAVAVLVVDALEARATDGGSALKNTFVPAAAGTTATRW